MRVDARHVRAKNGKSQHTFWFAMDPAFETIVEAWLAELARCESAPEITPFRRPMMTQVRPQFVT